MKTTIAATALSAALIAACSASAAELLTNGTFDAGNTGFYSGAGVPEPASWALMLVGFGGLGAMFRARRRLVPATA